MKVLAAMSGGVDSAVAAARAVEAGHDVTGVHFALSKDKNDERGSRGCCTLSDARDARRAADVLDIPFYVWDLSDEFRENVITDFLAEYQAGRTPNPCIRCNEHIKFAEVLSRAMELGFDAVCTGHYAQVIQSSGQWELRRARDESKDQSYVLAVVAAGQLQRILLPLGDTLKTDVRQEAEERGLKVARKPDSHDICFIPHGQTRTWLNAHLGEKPGNIIDVDTGEVLGEHEGYHGYTVGQRRGLGITRPAADGQPRYVISIDPRRNEIAVGSQDKLLSYNVTADHAQWYIPPWVGWQDGLSVQIRAHGRRVAARVSVSQNPDELLVEVHEPLRAVAAGQTVVVYDDDRVVASGTLRAASRPDIPSRVNS